VAGFLEDLQMPMPPMQRVNAGQLIAYIDRSWDSQRDLQARIDQVLPELQERARETGRIAVRLLTERAADPGAAPPDVVA
jgi:multidrug efflux pump subunit AcrA (membrane-fusion protein)